MVSDDEHDEPHDYQQARINLTSNLLKIPDGSWKKRGSISYPLINQEIRSLLRSISLHFTKGPLITFTIQSHRWDRTTVRGLTT